jgi:adenylate kinase
MRIILLGPPGAGKGTQAVLLSGHYKIPHVSTGEIMRAAVSAGSELGSKVKSFLDSGALVPDEVVIALIRERLQRPDSTSGFLLDGFPRTVDQAKALDNLLSELKITDVKVVELVVAESVLLERIRKRGEAGSGRSDDNAEVAARRLQTYWEQTAPVTLYYRNSGRVIEVDGLGTVEEVQSRVLAALAK